MAEATQSADTDLWPIGNLGVALELGRWTAFGISGEDF